MKSNKESGRNRPLIVGSAALAVFAAWLALRDNHVPNVVRGTRVKVADVIRRDAGVRMDDVGVRKALAAAMNKTVSKSAGTPKEPITSENALERARAGDIEAARFILGEVGSKIRANLDESFLDRGRVKTLLMILDSMGVTKDEYETFTAATWVVGNIDRLESTRVDDDMAVDAAYLNILHALEMVGSSGAQNPLLATLLGKSPQELRDLVSEVIAVNSQFGSKLSKENIEKLRAWYGLSQEQD